LRAFVGQLDGAAELAEACHKVSFIRQHAGRQDTGQTQAARNGVPEWSDWPPSPAFGTFTHRNDTAFNKDMLQTTVSIFAVRRCLFGSNFPIERLWARYGARLDALRAGTNDLSQYQWDDIFNDTAAWVYRI